MIYINDIYHANPVPNMTYNVFGGTLNPTLLLPATTGHVLQQLSILIMCILKTSGANVIFIPSDLTFCN